MASQVFYRKFRSQTLAELVGQSHVTRTLLNALQNNNISHAYLFCGPRGTGKTSTARILAKAINCLTNNGRGEPCNSCDMCRAIMEDRAMDVIEIDAASNRGIDDIRDLREKVNYSPTQARRKVYIIDEFHMLSREASNALLKTLEEPPPHVVFILATTEAHKVLPTILSRCQHFDFHRLSRSDVVAQLTKICGIENIEIEPQSLQLIARNTTGSLRDAENLLEQLTTFYGLNISFAQVQAMLGITGDSRVKELVKHIISRDISAGMATLNSVNNDGLDLKQFNRELIEYLRNLLLVKTGAVDSVDLTAEDIEELKALADQGDLSRILQTVKLFGQIELGNTENTTLPLELALIECYLGSDRAAASPAEPPAAPVEKAPLTRPAPVARTSASRTGTTRPAASRVTPAVKPSPSPAPSETTPPLPPQPAAAVEAASTAAPEAADAVVPPVAPPGTPAAAESQALLPAEPDKTPTVPAAPAAATAAAAAASAAATTAANSALPASDVSATNPADPGVAAAPGVTPAQPAVAGTPAPAAGPDAFDSEFEKLKSRWKQMLDDPPAEYRKTRAVAVMRSSCKPIALEADTVVLCLDSAVLRDILQKTENQQIAEKIVSDILGRPCKVRCTCDGGYNHLTRSAIKLGAQVIRVEEK